MAFAGAVVSKPIECDCFVDGLKGRDADGTSWAMDDFNATGKELLDAVAHDGVGLAATNFHEHPWARNRLGDLSRQGPSHAMVPVFVKIFHEVEAGGKATGTTVTRGGAAIGGKDHTLM
jgi:hypothetical protein